MSKVLGRKNEEEKEVFPLQKNKMRKEYRSILTNGHRGTIHPRGILLPQELFLIPIKEITEGRGAFRLLEELST